MIVLFKCSHQREKELDKPSTEKKSIKTADIWITLLLPTRVSASRPTFSL